jgi:hypothetical protein
LSSKDRTVVSAEDVAGVMPFFSLWDVGSGNSLGTYPTKEEALAVVRDLLHLNGVGYAEALDFGRRDANGGWTAIATGVALAARAQVGIERPIG